MQIDLPNETFPPTKSNKNWIEFPNYPPPSADGGERSNMFGGPTLPVNKIYWSARQSPLCRGKLTYSEHQTCKFILQADIHRMTTTTTNYYFVLSASSLTLSLKVLACYPQAEQPTNNAFRATRQKLERVSGMGLCLLTYSKAKFA